MQTFNYSLHLAENAWLKASRDLLSVPELQEASFVSGGKFFISNQLNGVRETEPPMGKKTCQCFYKPLTGPGQYSLTVWQGQKCGCLQPHRLSSEAFKRKTQYFPARSQGLVSPDRVRARGKWRIGLPKKGHWDRFLEQIIAIITAWKVWRGWERSGWSKRRWESCEVTRMSGGRGQEELGTLESLQ